MKIQLILTFLFFIKINLITSFQSKCDQFTNLNDREIITNIKLFYEEDFRNNYKKCFEVLIRKGKFDALEYFLIELLKKGISYKNDLNESISSYNEFLNNLKNKFKFKETDYQKVTPAIRWAQNKEYVFLEIKFSHRHDAPGKFIKFK
jgi:hypothetical protein